jgi:hypothetical protein
MPANLSLELPPFLIVHPFARGRLGPSPGSMPRIDFAGLR